MSKKRKHRRQTGQPARLLEPKPYLYNLPEDTQQVQLLAIIATMNAAFVARTTKTPLNAQLGIPALAVELALGHEQIELEGRQGTNEPIAFRHVFVAIVPRVYPAMMAILKAQPEIEAALEKYDGLERWQKLTAYVSEEADTLLEQITVGGNDPITLPRIDQLVI